jgi:hypothetical protein
MALGLKGSSASIVFFCDADLVGLQAEHVHRLMKPVIAGNLDMSIGIVDRGALANFFSGFLPAVSGQRILHREIFEAIPSRHVAGYGIECALNFSCRVLGKNSGRQHLNGVTVVRKTEKIGWWRGFGAYCRMWYRVVERAILVRLDRRLFNDRQVTLGTSRIRNN